MFFKPLILIVLTILLTAAFMAGCSRYQFHSKSPENKAEWIVKKISSELDLDDNQKAKLDKIKSEILAKHQNFGGMKSEIWNEVLSQVKTEKIDEEKLNALLTDKETQFREMHTFMVSKFVEFHAILTPEQRIELAEKMTKFKEKYPH